MDAAHTVWCLALQTPARLVTRLVRSNPSLDMDVSRLC